ncbi:MAG: hypothetical protein DRM99_00420 [Thermoplasmata archaeon]|nr:MAG: hypothetical protein DRM99_00420 [Thermoplasmata archaeon]
MGESNTNEGSEVEKIDILIDEKEGTAKTTLKTKLERKEEKREKIEEKRKEKIMLKKNIFQVNELGVKEIKEKNKIKGIKKKLKKKQKFFKNPYNLIFITILIVFIIVQSNYLLADGVWNDETIYMWLGKNLSKNPSYLFSQEMIYYSSFLPIVVISVLNCCMSTFAASHFMVFFFALAGLIFVYLLGKELKNELTGIIAVVLVSFNHLYNVICTRVLIDVPLATLFTIVAYCLIKYEKIKNIKWAILLAITLFITVTSKHTGILSVAFVASYYIFAYLIESIRRSIVKKKNLIVVGLKELFKRKSFYVFLIIFVILMVTLAIFRSSINAEKISGLPGQTKISELGWPTSIFAAQFPFIFGWIVLILFLVSIVFSAIFAFVQGKKEHYLLLAWFISFFGVFSMLHLWQSPPRYMIPIIPVVGIFIGLMFSTLISMIAKIRKKKIFTVITLVVIGTLLLFPVISYLGIYKNLQLQKQNTYIGYLEGGDWLKRNVMKNKSIIIAESYRQIRAFSGFEFEENGGIIYTESIFQNKTAFEEFLNKNNDKVIYLQTDIWEYTMPKWIHPLDQKKFDYLLSVGFKPVYGVEKEIVTREGPRKAMVVIIFQKDSGNFNITEIEEENGKQGLIITNNQTLSDNRTTMVSNNQTNKTE